MPFNPLTAYASEWRHLNANLVDDVRLERRTPGKTLTGFCNAKSVKPDANNPQYAVLFGSVMASAEQTVFLLYLLANEADPLDPQYSTLKPEPDDVLIFDYGTASAETWRIGNVSEPRVSGLYAVAATKASSNG